MRSDNRSHVIVRWERQAFVSPARNWWSMESTLAQPQACLPPFFWPKPNRVCTTAGGA